jgi:hypothetical protein
VRGPLAGALWAWFRSQAAASPGFKSLSHGSARLFRRRRPPAARPASGRGAQAGPQAAYGPARRDCATALTQALLPAGGPAGWPGTGECMDAAARAAVSGRSYELQRPLCRIRVMVPGRLDPGRSGPGPRVHSVNFGQTLIILAP